MCALRRLYVYARAAILANGGARSLQPKQIAIELPRRWNLCFDIERYVSAGASLAMAICESAE